MTGPQGPEGPAGKDGIDGKDGINGQDGFSPIANVSKVDKVATITITDKNGTTIANVSDGQDGANGQNGQDGYTPVKGTDYFTQEDIASLNIPTKTSELTNNSGFITGMVELSYGSSTWNDFINAYTAKKIVYCRASSSANPATGSQTRKAFMAYVNNADTPTNVEFQYVRSIASHSDTQQGDQVYVYKLTNANGGTWSVETREMATKIVPSTGLSGSYSSGTYILTANIVTSLSSQSTDTQIPSAKCVYDLIGDVETLLSEV